MKCAVRNCADPQCFARSCWRRYGHTLWLRAHPWVVGLYGIGVAAYVLWKSYQRFPSVRRMVGPIP